MAIINDVNINGSLKTMGSFNTHYLTNMSKFNKVNDYLLGGAVELANIFTSKSDYIVNALIFPFRVSYFCEEGENDYFYIGKTKILQAGDTHIIKNARARLMATYTFNRHFNNFMDFAPYTSITLHLPYLSFIDLPVNEVMGKTVKVYYLPDLDSGIVTAYITADDKIIMTTQNSVAISLPIGSNNSNEIMRNNITNALKTVAGVGMAAFSKTGLTKKIGLGLIASSTVGAISGNVEKVSHGSYSGNASIYGDSQNFYLIITRPIPNAVNDSYRKLKGLPLGEYRTLGSLNGFTIIENVHLTGFAEVTKQEQDMILQLFKEGIQL